MTSKLTMVTTPPDVVRTRASSTVLVKASSLVNRDLAGMLAGYRCRVVDVVRESVVRATMMVEIEYNTGRQDLGETVEVNRTSEKCLGTCRVRNRAAVRFSVPIAFAIALSYSDRSVKE